MIGFSIYLSAKPRHLLWLDKQRFSRDGAAVIAASS